MRIRLFNVPIFIDGIRWGFNIHSIGVYEYSLLILLNVVLKITEVAV